MQVRPPTRIRMNNEKKQGMGRRDPKAYFPLFFPFFFAAFFFSAALLISVENCFKDATFTLLI